jgi:hypothetical protein
MPDPYRRGLPAALQLHSLTDWPEVETRLLGRFPIEEIHLAYNWTYEQLQRWARSPLLQSVKTLHISGNPIEPLRVLRHHGAALAHLQSVHLLRGTGAGFTVALDEFLRAPIGQQLRELHLHVGHTHQVPYLLEALAAAPPLHALTLRNCGVQPAHLAELAQLPALQRVQRVDLSHNLLGLAGLQSLLTTHPWPAVHTLRLEAIGLEYQPTTEIVYAVSSGLPATALAALDLSRNRHRYLDLTPFWQHPVCAQLRSLHLRAAGHLLAATPLLQLPCFPHLVEIDLRDTDADDLQQLWRGLPHATTPPPALTAVVVSRDRLSAHLYTELASIFGDKLILAD